MYDCPHSLSLFIDVCVLYIFDLLLSASICQPPLLGPLSSAASAVHEEKYVSGGQASLQGVEGVFCGRCSAGQQPGDGDCSH